MSVKPAITVGDDYWSEKLYGRPVEGAAEYAAARIADDLSNRSGFDMSDLG